MIKSKSLEELIKFNINLNVSKNSKYHSVKCPMCSDYKERGGFSFSAGFIHYNCFNCGYSVIYDATDGHISKKLKALLISFGIPNDQILQVAGSAFFNKAKESNISVAELKKINLFTPIVELPQNSSLLTESLNPIFCEYLRVERNLTAFDYPFYISTDLKYNNRLIIPYFKAGKIIYWQARSIDQQNPRYKNCSVPRDAVIFNHDELFRNHDLPLFVCEGVFDAIHVNGIALAGSGLNETKIELLKKTRRELIFVIDQDKTGKHLAEIVFKLGMGSLTYAPRGHDICSSIVTNGKLWTIHELLKNKSTDKSILLHLDMLSRFSTRR
jgi:5S rRNA maturation endonuclease (ribonuclease M5)